MVEISLKKNLKEVLMKII